MQRITVQNDAGRNMLLFVTASVALVILAIVALEVTGHGDPKSRSMALAIPTLAFCWLFTNSVFALHYAHIYYLNDLGSGDGGAIAGGVNFPGARCPDFRDFVYFSFTLGMTYQTSDCQITGRHVRRVALFQTMVAFVFTIGVIAVTINLLHSGGGAETVVAR